MKKMIVYLLASVITLSSCSAGDEFDPLLVPPYDSNVSGDVPSSEEHFTESEKDASHDVVIGEDDIFDFVLDDSGSRAGLANVVSAVSESAVCITVSGKTSSYYFSYTTELNASGVIISDDGYILTANHVVEGGKTFEITLNGGESYSAELVAGDIKCDIAVLKIEATGLKAAKLANSKTLRVGDFVFTVGNSSAYKGMGASFGFVSALDTNVVYSNDEHNVFQINTCINSSNAGGGVFDSNGALVGIVSGNASNTTGIAFALPSSDIATATDDLINHGYVRGRPCTGFETVEINDMATAQIYGLSRLGVYVNSVEEGSSAAECGLQFKDYINAVDGETVISKDRLDEIIASKKIGESIILEVLRGDSTIDMVLVIEEQHG